MHIENFLEEISQIIEENKDLKNQIQKLLIENEELKKKEEYSLNMSLIDTAKVLNIKPHFFINYLIANKYLFRDRSGKLRVMEDELERGFFSILEIVEEKVRYVYTRVTPKGRDYFRTLYFQGDFKDGDIKSFMRN